MSQCIHLAFVLSLAMCEHASPPPAKPVEPVAKPAVKPDEPEPHDDEVRFMTRAGPKWVKKPKPEPPRVRREPVVAEEPAQP